jgi:hypothetical protein
MFDAWEAFLTSPREVEAAHPAMTSAHNARRGDPSETVGIRFDPLLPLLTRALSR